MADLSQLFKVAPTTAAFMTGGQQAMDEQSQGLEQQRLQQLIQSLQQKNQQDSVMNPLLVDQQRLNNQTLQTKIPGLEADNQTKVLANRQTEGTLESTINATNSKNDSQVAEDQIKRAKNVGGFLGNAGFALENVPVGQRKEKLASLLAGAGISANDPKMAGMLGIFSQIPEDKLPTALTTYGKQMLQQSEQYMQHLDATKMTTEARSADVAATNATNIKIANIRAEAAASKAEQAKGIEVLIAKAKTPAAKAEVLEAAAAQEPDPILKQQYIVRAGEARQRAAEDARNRNPQPRIDVPALAGVQAAQPAQATAPIGGAAPTGGGVSSGPIKNMSDLQKMYPGVPADKLRAVYKKKFGVDLQ